MASKIDLLGDEKLRKLLRKLPEKANKRIWRAAARKAAKPIIDSARSKVPKESGDLKRAIKYKNFRKLWGGFVRVDKKTDRGFQWMKAKVLSEGAEKERFHKNGKSVGNIKRPIRDFVKEAGEDSGVEAAYVMNRHMEKFIAREIKKLT